MKTLKSPILWVLPLTIYLASFIITFSGDRYYNRNHEQAEIRALRGQLEWEGDVHQQRLSRLEK